MRLHLEPFRDAEFLPDTRAQLLDRITRRHQAIPRQLRRKPACGRSTAGRPQPRMCFPANTRLTRPAPLAIHPTGAMPACGVELNITGGTTHAHSTPPRAVTKMHAMPTEKPTTRHKKDQHVTPKRE